MDEMANKRSGTLTDREYLLSLSWEIMLAVAKAKEEEKMFVVLDLPPAEAIAERVAKIARTLG
jgi:hypothetical protein